MHRQIVDVVGEEGIVAASSEIFRDDCSGGDKESLYWRSGLSERGSREWRCDSLAGYEFVRV